jgi:probable addiction module antidote protein
MERPATEEKQGLLERLGDARFCSRYLSASMRESPETFLMARRNVAEAQKGMATLASDAGVNRENLYRMLSEDGNPRLKSLLAVLEAMGLRVAVEPIAVEGVGTPKDSGVRKYRRIPQGVRRS